MENTIGYFQLDNLIRGRIPCLFVALEVDLKSWYGPLEKIHLSTWMIQSSLSEALVQINERKIPNDFGIVVLCQDGSLSKQLIPNLITAGYNNIYWVEGGMTALTLEKEQY